MKELEENKEKLSTYRKNCKKKKDQNWNESTRDVNKFQVAVQSMYNTYKCYSLA